MGGTSALNRFLLNLTEAFMSLVSKNIPLEGMIWLREELYSKIYFGVIADRVLPNGHILLNAQNLSKKREMWNLDLYSNQIDKIWHR